MAYHHVARVPPITKSTCPRQCNLFSNKLLLHNSSNTPTKNIDEIFFLHRLVEWSKANIQMKRSWIQRIKYLHGFTEKMDLLQSSDTNEANASLK